MLLLMDIIDAHVHLYNNNLVPHNHLNTFNPLFSQLLGDYSKLPRKYLFDDYTQSINHSVAGLVWREFVSDQPNDEIDWAANYLKSINIPHAMVAEIDFSAPDLIRRLMF